MKNFLKSKKATSLLAAILILIVLATGRLFAQKYFLSKQIKELEAKAEKIKSENDELGSMVSYFNTPQFKEKEAREKLNLRKDGEVVVGLPGNFKNISTEIPQEKTSNPKKWYDFFFNKTKAGQ